MSEWPKKIIECLDEDGYPTDLDEVEEVIPADLGRELVKALRKCDRWLDHRITDEGNMGDAMTQTHIQEALARYEREVE